MIAFRVSINGKEKFVTGIEDWDSLHTVIMALRADTDESDHTISLKIGGLAQLADLESSESVRWPHLDLEVGDEVSITIAEVDVADSPIERHQTERPVLDNSVIDEGLFELQKQDYLKLKELFKDEGFAYQTHAVGCDRAASMMRALL
jgi:hypothetical protein